LFLDDFGFYFRVCAAFVADGFGSYFALLKGAFGFFGALIKELVIAGFRLISLRSFS